MSHFSATSFTPFLKMKKILAITILVLVAHAMVFALVSLIPPAELKKVQKEPLKVRFVKIQEQPEPLPPEPKPEPKPKPPAPKKEVKEVKVVEKPIIQPPKKIEKVQQVKSETPKTTVQVTETRIESKDPPIPVTAITEKVVEKPMPVEPVKTTTSATPKRVSIGGAGVQWKRSPQLSINSRDLEGQARRIVVLIEADENGQVVNVRITQSSGLTQLDEKIVRAVRRAKFKPYTENGVAYPIRAEQPFDLTP